MIVDALFVATVFAYSWYPRRWFSVILAGAAICVGEFYSLLPFGLFAAGIIASICALRIMLFTFDASSWFVLGAAYCITFAFYSGAIMLFYAYLGKMPADMLVSAATLFFIRQLLATCVVGVLLFGIRQSRAVYAYAFVEEKKFIS